jgi:hypothetical protein
LRGCRQQRPVAARSWLPGKQGCARGRCLWAGPCGVAALSSGQVLARVRMGAWEATAYFMQIDLVTKIPISTYILATVAPMARKNNIEKNAPSDLSIIKIVFAKELETFC